VTAVPNVVTIPGVEIVKVGTWQCSSGEWSPTKEDLAAAVAAHRAGILRRPPIHLGHDGPMRDAGPALGYLDRLRTTDGGTTLLADLVGVPRAVAAVIAQAYRDRSVEALIDYQAPDGTVWPLVIQGLAMLGAVAPGVPNLASLPDVAALYDVDLAASSARRITLAASAFHPDPDPDARARAVAVAAARRRRTHRINPIGV
jgi:hypothetical protein